MIDITLPDGSVNEYAAGVTCAEVITDALGKSTDAWQQRWTAWNVTCHACLMKIVPSRAFGRIPKRAPHLTALRRPPARTGRDGTLPRRTADHWPCH